MTSVKVRLQGGLGNQLFQYCAGKYFASRQNSSLILEFNLVGRNGINHGNYLLELVQDKNAKIIRGNIFELALTRVFKRIAIKYKFWKKNFQKYGYIFSEEVGFDKSLENFHIRYLEGYYQTWRYFESTLQKDLPLFLKSNGNSFFNGLKEFMNANYILSIHVRRGDYTNLENEFGLLSKTYYSEAIKEALKNSPKPYVFVFSDDIGIAYKLLEEILIDFEVKWIGGESGITPAETLSLISLSKIIIIANSTFSYWAAMLSAKNTIIYAPSKWFKGMNDPIDLIPPNWKIIESSWEQ